MTPLIFEEEPSGSFYPLEALIQFHNQDTNYLVGKVKESVQPSGFF